MHMLVLYANTGCKMDLSSYGYTVDIINRILPLSVYTPCIEEHNIHAIFRWTSIWELYKDSCDTAVKTGGLHTDNLVIPTMPEDETNMVFLKQTGLTLSVTTLGTCIYRFGKKRCRETSFDGAENAFAYTCYVESTEQMIFQVCQYVHKIISSS